MKSILLQVVLSLGITSLSFGQNISGTVRDEDGNPIADAQVLLLETKIGISTNLNGYFLFKNLEKGSYELVTSYIGYLSDTSTVILGDDAVDLSIALSTSLHQLDDAIVHADKITERTSISNVSFSTEDLRTSQGLIEDPLRTLAALPGIGRGGDLFSPSALYVRGGDPSENLFLLDNNKIYFPYYFGGQKSIFNTDITESIELLTGGFSAMYGNHMSSVLNVTTRDGNMDHLKGMVSLGFYNSSGIIEGPIQKDQTSFLVAIRRTYLDLLLKDKAEFPTPSFGDISYKLTHRIGENHKISFSGISSDEKLDFTVADPTPGLPNVLKTSGNNHFQTLQLQSRFSDKLYNKLSLTNAISTQNVNVGTNLYLDIDAQQSGIRDDLSIYLSDKSTIRTGLLWQYGVYDFDGTFPLDPTQIDPNDTTIRLVSQTLHDKGESQRSAYLLYDGIIARGLGMNAGFRYDYNPGNEKSDLSPRFSMNYQLSSNGKLRMATGVYRQFPNEGVPDSIVSQQAIHYILGYEHKFSQSLYGWIEAYYKDYSDLVIYNDSLEFSNNGLGSAKGVELFLRKESGDLRGWISYALSHSQRTVPLGTEIKDFEFDQRYIFNIVAEYHIRRWEEKEKWYIPVLLHTNIRAADGTPYTPVIGAVQTSNGWRPIEGEPLSVRNPDYFNVNLRIEWNFKVGRNGQHRGTSFMEAWNVLNRKNIQGRNYQYGSQYPNNVNVNEYYATGFLFGGGFRIEFGN